MKRPILPVLLWYTAGVVIGAWVALPIVGLFILSFVALGIAFSSAWLRPVVLGPLLLFAGAANVTCKTTVLSPIDIRLIVGENIETARVRGTIIQTPTHRIRWRNGKEIWRTLAVIEADSINCTGTWQRVSGRIAADVPGVLGREYFSGRAVEVSGVLQHPPGPAAPGLFDYRSYLRWQGIYYRLQTRSTNNWALVGNRQEKARPPLSDRFVQWAQKILARGLPSEDEPLRLLWAMTLGWRTALTDEVSEPFMKTGTMHIFAISGLHVALLATILVAVLRVVRVPRSVCGVIIIPTIWFYTAATGWQASAIRSSIMMTVVVVGWALRRPGDLLNSLAASAFLILVWDPRQLFQAGFQLSFFVVLSMALLGGPFMEWIRATIRTDPWVPKELLPAWKRWAISGLRNTANAFAVSLSAWLGSLPLIAMYFHLVTPVSLGANLVMVPLSGAALTCSLGSLLCGAWAGWVSELFNNSAWFWMRLMMLISERASELPGAYFRVPTPHVGLVCAYYLALVAAGVQGPRARRWRAGLVLTASTLFVVFCLGAWNRRGEVMISILPMRGGHAVVIDAPSRENDLLIDCGDEQSAAFVVKAYLESRGFSTLPCMVLTHGDVRHVGGASLIAEEFQVATVCTGQNRSRSPSYRQMLAQLAQEPNRWRKLCSGDTVAGLRVVHPERGESFAMADDNAIVLAGELGGVRVLLLSDLGPEGQAALVERAGLGHGGIIVTGLPSKGEPLNESLIEAVNPELVIVADADWPAYERAGDAVRKRLERTGVPVLYCSDVGTVTLRLKAGRWRLSTMNSPSPEISPPHGQPEKQIRRD